MFKGKVEKDSVKVVITPMNCTFKGVASNTETVYTNDTPCTFVGNSLENLNTEFAQLKVTPLQTQNVLLNITIDDEPTNYQFSFLVIPKKYTTLSVSLNTGTQMNVNRWTEIPVVFSGEIIEDDLRQITISPKNCTLKGMKTNNQETTEPYSFTPVSIEIANKELAKLQIMPSSESETSISIQIENEESQEFIFSNIQPTPKTNLTASIDTSVELTVNRESAQTSFSFTGTIESDDIRTVTITPTNCKFKVNDSIEYTNSNVYSKVVNSLDEINNELTNIKIIATSETNVLITVNTGGTDAPQIFTFTTINPRPQTTLTVTCDDTENSIQAQVASNIAIVLAGTIETDDLRSLTLTPNNCSFTNINDTDTVYIHESPFTVEVFDIGTINSQLDNISLTATNTSDVTITATINKVDEPTVFTFTNVTPAPVSNISAVTTTTENFNQSEETQNVQITVEGNFYTWDSKTVTVTPSGCTFTNVTDDDTSGTYTNVAPLTIENVTNISNINNKLNNLSITVTELNASITVAIADGNSQQVTLTVIPAVSISLGEYTPVNWGEYTTATAMTIGGYSLESAEVFPEVKITPTNCRFKGVTDSSETEYTNDSPYTVTATNLEELNGKLNAIQILTFGNSPKIEIESEGHTNSIEINSIEKDHELTVSCESLDSALTNGTESSAMALVFDGTFVIGKTVTVKITPNNCSFKGVTGDLETVYTNESPLTITATESVSELNSKVNTITVTPLNTTDVKLTVLIDDTPTELAFTNVSPA